MSPATNSNSARSVADLTPKGRATRKRILQTAAQYTFTHGVAATSIEEIRRVSKASPSQLTHYFGGRHNLVSAVIEQLTEATLKNQEPLLSNLDSFAAFEAWCQWHITNKEERNFAGGCPVGALVGQVSEVDPEWRDSVAQGFEVWRETIAKGIRTMQSNGLLRSDASADKLSTSALAALEGGTLLAQATRTAEPLVDALDMFMSLLRSYSAKP